MILKKIRNFRLKINYWQFRKDWKDKAIYLYAMLRNMNILGFR